MKLEDQVVSLELAKRLNEVGVTQSSLFFWTIGGVVSRLEALPILESNYSAFTVAELGNMIPRDRVITTVNYGSSSSLGFDGKIHLSNNEADARAICLIYILENGLVKVEDINNDSND